jgi:hypothetical protein
VGGDLVVFGLEWMATRYGLEPLADLVQARARTMLNLAIRKAKGRSLNYDERTVIKSLQEIASSDSAILSDYLAGVIAGSGEADDGVSTVAQIGRLSSLQLRMHYVIYRALWQMEGPAPTGYDLRSHFEVASNLELFLSLEDLHLALPIDANGEGVRSMLMALHVLAREDLIGAHTSAGPTDLRPSGVAYDVQEPWRLMQLRPKQFPFAALICRPTPPGIELFLRGCGSEQHDPTFIRSLDAELVQLEIPDVSGGLIARLPSTA